MFYVAGKSTHAEIDCINNINDINRKQRGYKIVIVRIIDGELKDAEPCRTCHRIIKKKKMIIKK